MASIHEMPADFAWMHCPIPISSLFHSQARQYHGKTLLHLLLHWHSIRDYKQIFLGTAIVPLANATWIPAAM